MKIGDYESLPGKFVSWETPFLAAKGGRVYSVRKCAEEVRGRRLRQIRRAMRKAFEEKSCLIMPDIFRVKNAYYSAEAIGRLCFEDLPAGFIFALEGGQKRRIVLSALSALAVLERNGIVHGNIDRHAFHLDVARDGGMFMYLGGLDRCGIIGKFPPVFLCDREFIAPEAADLGVEISSAADVFSMGMCMHYWLSGELPVYSVVSEAQHYLISDRIPRQMVPVIGMMLAPKPFMRPTASAVIWMLQDEVKVNSSTEYKTYSSAQPDHEYLDEIVAAIYPDNPDLMPDIMMAEAVTMGWALPAEDDEAKPEQPEQPGGSDISVSNLIGIIRRTRR